MHPLWRATTVGSLLLIAACEPLTSEDDAPGALAQQGGLDAGRPVDRSTASVVVIRDRDAGTPLFSIRFIGRACALGTYAASMERDGTVQVQFSEYSTALEPDASTTQQLCTLAIIPADPSISYAVGEFHAQAYSFLDRDVQGYASFSYYASSAPAGMRRLRWERVGPHDAYFVLDDVVPTEALNFGHCGRANLEIATRLAVLRNGASSAAEGYVSLTSVDDGRGGGWLRFKLVPRPCAATDADASR